MCPFCSIVAGEIPAQVIATSEHCLAILDIFPITRGHTLVLPQRHYEQLLELEEEVLCDLALLSRKVSGMLRKALPCDGVNLISNNGKTAQQTIPHAAVHILPRVKDDHIRMPSRESRFGAPENEQVLSELARKIRDA